MIRPVSLPLLVLLCTCAVSRQAAIAEASEEDTSATRDKPVYRIYPLRNGVCSVKGKYAFLDNEDDPKSYEYALYIWLVLGGEKPILIDAGLKDVAHMNRGAAEVFQRPISQQKDETAPAQLRKFGLQPEDIGHVLITHLHFDHVDALFSYSNAVYHIGRKEWELASANGGQGSWCDGRILFPLLSDKRLKKRINLIGDETVLPGIEAFWVGGHTPGSMAYRIATAHGKVVCTGDTVSLLENMERPVGVFSSEGEVKAAVTRIRAMADFVLPSHDPGTLGRWPPVPDGTPRYTVRPVRVGECQVTNEITFQDAWGDTKTRTYVLYVWLLEGGGKPIVVETGPNPLYVDAFNRSTAKYIPGGIKQTPDENTVVALKRAGVEPSEVSHVIVTHCHADHYDYISAFPNARFVVNKREFEDNRRRFPEDVARALKSRPGVVQAVEDAEIVPGIRAIPLGCHTRGSQGVLVQTYVGPVMLCGDVVYVYQNIEEDRPGRSPDPQKCRKAMAKIRSLADIILPAHDPLVLERWPTGIVGGKPR